MKILSIGTDRKIFEEGSAVRRRMEAYARLVDELHIIVFSNKNLGFKDFSNEEGLFVYSTNSTSRWHYIRDAKRVGKSILSKNKDISLVDTQDPFETGIVGAYLSQMFDLPLLVQVHTDFMSPFFKHTFLNRIRVVLSKKSLTRARRIRVVSERIKQSLEDHYPQTPVTVLPIYVDPDHHAVDESIIRKPHTILMVSRLEKEKRIDRMLRIMYELKKEYPDMSLQIIGDGSERSILELYVKTHSLDDMVTFLGWRDDSEKFFASASCFVNTSLYEGYGRTLIEAALSKCPLITTDVGLVGSILYAGKDALVCPVGDHECLKSALRETFDKYENAKRRAESAREKALWAHPSFDEYLQKYRTMWSDCLK